MSLQTICLGVSEEIDEIYRRLSKALKDRTEHLRSEIDKYLTTELRYLTHLRENLELEIKNIQSNCDVADKYMVEAVEWDDSELMDTKEIFLKTVEFIRNFEYENNDYNRKIRYTMSVDPNTLVVNLSTFGDLHTVAHPGITNQPGNQNSLQAPSGGPGLLRSKSDHRLASQFRQQEERDDEPCLGGRKFGERPQKSSTSGGGSSGGGSGGAGDRYGESRYGRGNEYEYDYDNEQSSRQPKSRFRSRFVRHQDNDSDNESSRNVKFSEKDKEKERERVLDTEDVTRGQLSGIIRLTDSPRVMKRLQEQESGKKEKKEVAPVAPVQVQRAQVQTKKSAPAAARQLSEDDEIARIKRQNKGAAATSSSAAATGTDSERPTGDRVAALKQQRSSTAGSEERDSSRRSTPHVEVSFDDD